MPDPERRKILQDGAEHAMRFGLVDQIADPFDGQRPPRRRRFGPNRIGAMNDPAV